MTTVTARFDSNVALRRILRLDGVLTVLGAVTGVLVVHNIHGLPRLALGAWLGALSANLVVLGFLATVGLLRLVSGRMPFSKISGTANPVTETSSIQNSAMPSQTDVQSDLAKLSASQVEKQEVQTKKDEELELVA